MATVDTIKKNWKNAVLAKLAVAYDRSGKYATNFKCFLKR